MDNIIEQEQPKQERLITLGEEFSLFDPKYTNEDFNPNLNVDQFRSQIKLNVEEVNIPITNYAVPSRSPKGQSITPFNPELGYQIDSEDLTLESRIAKMRRLDKELRQNIDFAKAPLNIDILSPNYALHELGLNRKNQMAGYTSSQKMLDLSRRLRVVVIFPKSRFEAFPWETSLFLGEVQFRLFYPIDSGPLPISKTYSISGPQEGFSLYVPSDQEKLAQIRAKFVLADEQEKYPESSSG